MTARKKSKLKSKPRSAPQKKARSDGKPTISPPNGKTKCRQSGRQGRPPAGTVDWTITFLESIRDGAHVRDAAADANINGTLPYRRRDEDEAFRREWANASKIGTSVLEAEACRRAYHGTVKPVYQGGRRVGEHREYSDQLLMFLLRARKPKKYRENGRLELAGKGGAALPAVTIYLPDNGRGKIVSNDIASEGNSERPEPLSIDAGADVGG